MSGFKKLFLVLSICILVNSLSGCTYLKNRKNDAMDMFDVGLTLSSKPQFALYMDIAKVIPIGYSNLDGKLVGLGRSSWGSHDFRQKGYGYLVGGELQRGLDNYDVDDPNDPKMYETGITGFSHEATIYHDDPAANEVGRPKTRPTCPKTLHLGWIGFELGCKVWDMADFLLGWTTIDIGDDDEPMTESVE